MVQRSTVGRGRDQLRHGNYIYIYSSYLFVEAPWGEVVVMLNPPWSGYFGKCIGIGNRAMASPDKCVEGSNSKNKVQK